MTTFKDFQNLAKHLASVGIMNASLEVQYQTLLHLKSVVDKEFAESAVIYDSEKNGDKIPGFTLELYRVKMYFNDPKTVIERS